MSKSVLITGASGWIGKALSRALLETGHSVVGLVRRPNSVTSGVREWVSKGDVYEDIFESWPADLSCGVVIHSAARVHQIDSARHDAIGAYRATNVSGTLRVARAAREAGATRFVFLSSVKALAEADWGRPLTEMDAPVPADPYGISKLEAEIALTEYGRQSGLEVVIVRPPLVYGPGVRANFLRLLKALNSGMPLPLASPSARRSVIFLDNLVDVLLRCAFEGAASGQTFHVADHCTMSLDELTTMMARALGVSRRAIYLPRSWLRFAGRITGRAAQVDRLTCDLRLDTSHAAEVLGWNAKYSTEEGLRNTAAWFRSLA